MTEVVNCSTSECFRVNTFGCQKYCSITLYPIPTYQFYEYRLVIFLCYKSGASNSFVAILSFRFYSLDSTKSVTLKKTFFIFLSQLKTDILQGPWNLQYISRFYFLVYEPKWVSNFHHAIVILSSVNSPISISIQLNQKARKGSQKVSFYYF